MSAQRTLRFITILFLAVVMAVFGLFATAGGATASVPPVVTTAVDIEGAFPGLGLGLDPAFAEIDVLTLNNLVLADRLLVTPSLLPGNVNFLTLRQIVLLERILSLQGIPFEVRAVPGLRSPVIQVIEVSLVPGTLQQIVLIQVPAIVTIIPIVEFGVFDFDDFVPGVVHVAPRFVPRPPVFFPKPPAFLPRPRVIAPEAPAFVPRPPVAPQPPAFVPRPPVAPQPPAFVPRPPVAPQAPAFAPRAPAIAPRAPAVAPRAPAFAPRAPAFAPRVGLGR